MKSLSLITVIVLAAGAMGCSTQFVMRDTDTYRQDTRMLLSTKNGEIKACYDTQLKADPKTSGSIVVNFKLEAETGKVLNVQLDETKSMAPEALKQCVLKAMDSLVLDPPDQNEGVASFSWEFRVNS
jgi:hypothetical protein